MKIGILTYHRSQNYGALLQARAMQEYLRSLGHDTYFIDYWPKYSSDVYKPFAFERFKKLSYITKVKYCIRALLIFIRQSKRAERTNKFIENYLTVSDAREFDAVIYGSDQIWRKQRSSETGYFNPIYFGNNYVFASKKIAYAASMGKIEIDTIEDVEFIKKYLQNFSSLSVREKQLQNVLQSKTNIDVSLVLDPVFLLTRNQWLSFINKEIIPDYKYIFYYRLAPLKETDIIVETLVKKTGYKVIEMRGYMPNFKFGHRYKMTSDARDFLSYLTHAEYVVTSSFHGTALSTIMGKQFYCYCKSGISDRLTSLLSILNLSDRFITKYFDKIEINNIIDYSVVDKIREECAVMSRLWLNKSLS